MIKITILEFALIVFLIGISSCTKEDLSKDVFLGFKLGYGKNDFDEHYKSLLSNGTFDRNEDRTPYFLHKGKNNFKYYSSMYGYTAFMDTLICKIRLYYFTDNKSMAFVIDDAKKDIFVNYLDNENKTNLMEEDIIDDLTKKYGKNDYVIPFPERETNTKRIYWNNRNGVNIILARTKFIYASGESLFVEFTYTDDYASRVFKQKSVY